MNLFSTFSDDAGRQVHQQIKNRFDVMKRMIHAVMLGSSTIDVRPIPDQNGDPVYLSRESYIAHRLLETRDDLQDASGNLLARKQDVRYVVEIACELACYYLDVRPANPRITVDDDYLKRFYDISHEERVRKLERKGATVYTIAFFIHVINSVLHVYNAEDTTVYMANTLNFNTTLAIKEIVLWLLCAGQDCNKNNYILSGEGESKIWKHVPGEFGYATVSVPGINLSQLDARNQEALGFVRELLSTEDSEEFPKHIPHLFAKGGYGSRPDRFFSGPVYMSGWPATEAASDALSVKKFKICTQ